MGLEGNSKECYDKSIEYASHLINGEASGYSLVRDPEKLCQIFSNNETNGPCLYLTGLLSLNNWLLNLEKGLNYGNFTLVGSAGAPPWRWADPRPLNQK